MEGPESQADVCSQGVFSKHLWPMEAIAASDSKKKKKSLFSKMLLTCKDGQWQFLPCLCFVVVFFLSLVHIDQCVF